MNDSKFKVAQGRKQSLQELESEVELHRRRFGASVATLREKVDDISDWRHWVKVAPWKFVFGCVVAGWAVGQITSRRR